MLGLRQRGELVAEAVIQGQLRGDAPLVLGIEAVTPNGGVHRGVAVSLRIGVPVLGSGGIAVVQRKGVDGAVAIGAVAVGGVVAVVFGISDIDSGLNGVGPLGPHGVIGELDAALARFHAGQVVDGANGLAMHGDAQQTERADQRKIGVVAFQVAHPAKTELIGKR